MEGLPSVVPVSVLTRLANWHADKLLLSLLLQA